MRWHGRYALLLLGWIVAGEASCAVAQVADSVSLTETPLSFLDYPALMRKELSLVDAPAPMPTSTPKLQMFRMPSGFLAAPLGLIPDNDPPPDDPSAKTDDDDLSGVQVVYGTHVPHLDMFRRGDPGGFGYYKIHSQVQIFDLGPTNVSFAVQAVTPMGLQNGGLANGTTYVSPGLACFHDLGDGAAVHAYIGQQVAANARWRDQLSTGVRYGLAVQHPVPLTTFSADQGWFVFVQALGQYRPDLYRNDVRGATWDVVPGLQYRLNNACWMSMGISRYSFLSCTMQY